MLPSARPGLWEVVTDRGVERRGVELVSGLRPPREEHRGAVIWVEAPEAMTLAIAPFGDECVLMWYVVAENDADGRWIPETIRHSIAIFSREGDLLGRAGFPPGLEPSTGYFHLSPVTGHLFVAVLDPYPQVVELRLVEEGGGSCPTTR